MRHALPCSQLNYSLSYSVNVTACCAHLRAGQRAWCGGSQHCTEKAWSPALSSTTKRFYKRSTEPLEIVFAHFFINSD